MNETRIAELRRAKGWTQEQLAAASGVGIRTVQRVESGHDASMSTIGLLADALGVQVSELFVRVEHDRFEQAVDGLEARRRQQARRDAYTAGVNATFRGVGVLVVFVTAALVLTGVLNGMGWLIIPAYWGGGQLLLMAAVHLWIDPRLDRRFPLTVPSSTEHGGTAAPAAAPGGAPSAGTTARPSTESTSTDEPAAGDDANHGGR
ncbi:helix-turn-helix domain-containing protein [Mycetocola reblochoni]|uniref:HTH cro/C1-type domain-containing protein n=2 Tax=Mycetocola reblochoni TaxID=331618 RepID=A0A1R4JGJ1_9MICO|nr:helix-turn-helix transcriptional regulator [Mycetocola reblochoni]RLP68237.1 XRE family transcriptional regulator [Mycetocola reblochoni]SJN31136.1 hypothetical protein FM119_07400 [Mycetocola reblochoni REB411]